MYKGKHEAVLVLRRPQLAALKRDLDQRFIDRMVHEFSSKPPGGDVIPAPSLRSLVTESVERAKGYGFQREWDIYRYVRFQVKRGPLFEERDDMKWAAAILADTQLSSTEKMDKLAYRFAVGAP